MKIKRFPFWTLFMIITLLLTMAGCNADKSANSGSSESASRETVFALYNKVQLSQNKSQIDAVMEGSGKENANFKNSFTYMDKNSEFGVEVLYDEQQQAISKTVIYPSHEDIAPFTVKEVSQSQADKIQKGIDYNKLKKLLGGDGVEVNATEIPFENNKISYMYRWANKDGSCIQVVVLTDGTVGNVLFFEK